MTPAKGPLDEAARWRARLSADDLTPGEAQAFDAWLADEEHAAAWRATEEAWTIWDAADEHDPRITALRRAARRPRLRATFWASGALAAGLAVAVAVGLSIGEVGPVSRGGVTLAAGKAYTTSRGEVRRISLADGSALTLDAESTVHVRLGGARREVMLDRGRARFQVAHDAVRPFVVTARGRSVTALGTVFDVELIPDAVAVTLMQGRVVVRAPAHETVLNPGERLTAPDRSGWTRQVVAIEAVGWPVGRLVFESRALSAVASEMNRYSSRRLVVADSVLGATPISGVFQAGDVAALAAGLETNGTARVARRTAEEIVLTRP